MHVLPAFLIYLLAHLHLTVLEPAIREGIQIAQNPVVRKDVRIAGKAIKAVAAYEKARNKSKGASK
jgi:hypothetical protein